MSERTIHRCARLAPQGFTKKRRDLHSACRATLEVSSRKVRIRAAWRARKTHIHRTLAEQPRATRAPQGAGPALAASLARSACPERVSTRRTTLARAVHWVIFQMCRSKHRAAGALLVAGQALAALLPLAHKPQPQWWVANLLPSANGTTVVRLPSPPAHQTWCDQAGAAAIQTAVNGGCWLQIQSSADVQAQRLVLGERANEFPTARGAVSLDRDGQGQGQLWLSNNHLKTRLGPQGVEQLHHHHGGGWGEPLLSNPMALKRYADRGEFWDAWDIAADYSDHHLPMAWEPEEETVEAGPLCTQLRWRGQCGQSPVQLSVRLQADTPWLELIVTAQWRQLHELWRCEVPLSQIGAFWCADTPGGVQERSCSPRTKRSGWARKKTERRTCAKCASSKASAGTRCSTKRSRRRGFLPSRVLATLPCSKALTTI